MGQIAAVCHILCQSGLDKSVWQSEAALERQGLGYILHGDIYLYFSMGRGPLRFPRSKERAMRRIYEAIDACPSTTRSYEEL